MWILSSYGWTSFVWISLTWVFHVAECLVVVFIFLLISVPYGHMVAFHFGFHFSGTQIAVLFTPLYNLVVSRNYLPPLFSIFLSKQITVGFFLIIRVSPSGVTWKHFGISRVMLNAFLCRPGITEISDNVTQWSFLSRFCLSCQSPRFSW